MMTMMVLVEGGGEGGGEVGRELNRDGKKSLRLCCVWGEGDLMSAWISVRRV